MIRIREVCAKGDEQILMPLEEAREYVADKLRLGWIVAINKQAIHSPDEVQDDSEVRLYPPIAGG